MWEWEFVYTFMSSENDNVHMNCMSEGVYFL